MGAEFDCGGSYSFHYVSIEPKEMIEMNIKELLSNLMKKIDKALIDKNEIMFNKLSKQYKYLSMEM